MSPTPDSAPDSNAPDSDSPDSGSPDSGSTNGASPDCVFCKIAAGVFPSNAVLDTPDAIAFLDINPIAEGHTLLIPKRHFTTIDEMPPENLTALTRHLPTLVAAIQTATGAKAVNILQNNGPAAGQVVMHVHFHIIPRAENDGLGFRWNPGKYPENRATQLQTAIQNALGE